MTRRGPYAKGAAKREEILAVALEVVAVKGYRKASNREIAERVGLSQAGLMHYFDSREELYQEVLRSRDRRDHSRFFEPDPTIDGFLAVIENNARVQGLVRLYAEFSAEATLPEHPSHAFFVERYDWLRQVMTALITRAQEAGEMGPKINAPLVADLLLAASDGLQVQWLLDPSLDMAVHLRLLWDGFVAASR